MRGYVGLGSNVGDRLANLRAACFRLAGPEHGEPGEQGAQGGEIAVVASSSVYETEPQGDVIEQPDFLNACLAIESELGAEAVLDRCKAVEQSMRREPAGPRHGPRPIDVDLLLLGDLRHRSERLTLPHPELLRRRFVLVPLLELDARLALPDGTCLTVALDGLEGQRVDRVGAL